MPSRASAWRSPLPRAARCAATAAAGTLPRASVNWKTRPRAGPDSSASRARKSGFRRRRISARRKWARRRRTMSRRSPSRNSPGSGSARGVSTPSPAARRPTLPPAQAIEPSASRRNSPSPAPARRRARAAISPRSTRAAPHALGGVEQAPRLLSAGARIGNEAEAVEAADELPFDEDLARAADGGEELAVAGEVPRQHRRAAVDEALRQAVVERVGEAVLDGARPLLPARGIGEPVAAMGDVGPGADMGDARRQRVEIAVAAVEPLDLAQI